MDLTSRYASSVATIRCILCVQRATFRFGIPSFENTAYHTSYIIHHTVDSYRNSLSAVSVVCAKCRIQVYSSVGKKIKADLLTGNAVVLFAYGLSGSGKTFTVFGPDAVDEPEVTSS